MAKVGNYGTTSFGQLPIEEPITLPDVGMYVPGEVWGKVYWFLDNHNFAPYKEFIFDTPERRNGGVLIVFFPKVEFVAMRRPRTLIDYIDVNLSRS